MSDKVILKPSENLWLKVWLANYNDESEVSQYVMASTKKSFKGDRYLPWALMVGALYRLDGDAIIEKCMNKDGGYVFTDQCTIITVREGVETAQTVLSHFIKIKVTFLGKMFEEAYPIQDNDYGASKVYDQNKVNKAQQRGLARTISLATGIGWRLYEQSEAQFEDDKAPTKVEKPVIKSVQTDVVVKDGSTAQTVARLIIDNAENKAMLTLLGNYNEVLQGKYVDTNGDPLVLSPEDGFENLVKKISSLENPDKMLKGLTKAVGA